MAPIGRAVFRIAIFILLGAQSTSCRGRTAMKADSDSIESCPFSATERVDGMAVAASDGRIRLVVPPDLSSRRTVTHPLWSGNVWTGSSGWAVRYSVQQVPVRMRPILRGDQNVVTCSFEGGERHVTVQMLYSEGTTVPGQRVFAIWQLTGDSSLVVTAFHPDSSRREELVNVLLSVRIVEPGGTAPLDSQEFEGPSVD